MGLLAIGCAAHSTKQQTDYQRIITSTKAALVSAGDPDSLAVAALLGGGWLDDGSPKSLLLIARAAEAAPDQPDLIWLHAQFCSRQKSCNVQPILEHLQSLDPKNGAAWIEPYGPADETSSERLNARLSAVANSERFDVYWSSIIVRTKRAILKTGTMDPPFAVLTVLGVAAGLPMPGYSQLIHACKGKALDDAQILDECRRISGVLRRGDTNVAEVVGIIIAERTWKEGTPEYQDAFSARHTMCYRERAVIKLTTTAQWDDAYASDYLQLVASHRTEQAVVLAQIVKAGLAPDSP